MKSSFVFGLLKNALHLVKQDIIIFTPFLIFNFLYTVCNLFFIKHFNLAQTPKTMSANTISMLLGFLALSFIMSLFFKLIVIGMTATLNNHTKINIPAILKQSLNKFWVILINIFLILLPFLIGFMISIYKINTLSNTYNIMLQKYGGILAWLGISMIGFLSFIVLSSLSLIIEFIPIMKLLNSQNSQLVISSTIRFLLHNFSNSVLFFLITFIIRLFFWTLLAMVINIPMIGISVLSAIIQAISDTLICVMAVIFYQKTISTIEIVK